MSIYIDPEEYYCSQEPERLSEETEKYLRSVLMAVAWFQEDVEVVQTEDSEDNPFHFRINFPSTDDGDEGDW